jgi:hypothetical protein
MVNAGQEPQAALDTARWRDVVGGAWSGLEDADRARGAGIDLTVQQRHGCLLARPLTSLAAVAIVLNQSLGMARLD